MEEERRRERKRRNGREMELFARLTDEFPWTMIDYRPPYGSIEVISGRRWFSQCDDLKRECPCDIRWSLIHATPLAPIPLRPTRPRHRRPQAESPGNRKWTGNNFARLLNVTGRIKISISKAWFYREVPLERRYDGKSVGGESHVQPEYYRFPRFTTPRVGISTVTRQRALSAETASNNWMWLVRISRDPADLVLFLFNVARLLSAHSTTTAM